MSCKRAFDTDDSELAPPVALIAHTCSTSSDDQAGSQSPKRVLADESSDADDVSSCCSSAPDESDDDSNYAAPHKCENCRGEFDYDDEGEFDVAVHTDVNTRQEWHLCRKCAVCFLCQKALNSARHGRDSDDDDFNYVAVDCKGAGGKRRFACSAPMFSPTLIGCGSYCTECGVVPAPSMVEQDCDGQAALCHNHSSDCLICGRVFEGSELLQLFLGERACKECARWCDDCESAHPNSVSCAAQRRSFMKCPGDRYPGHFKVRHWQLVAWMRTYLRRRTAKLASRAAFGTVDSAK